VRKSVGSSHQIAVRSCAAENTVCVASVNGASEGLPITSAIAGPDGPLVLAALWGVGLLVADLDLNAATGLLAQRCGVSGS